jgi:hypothetical protein
MQASILIIAPGLYEINFGIFSRKRPAVQVLVNGDPVLSAMNNCSYATSHSSVRMNSVSNHPAGNITGFSCMEFLSLPSKARIAITCSGEEKAEGFMSLKRL